MPLFWKADKKSIHQVDDGNSTKSFVFGMRGHWVRCLLLTRPERTLTFPALFFTDRVFTADETTNQLYQDIAKPLVVSTVKGYNGMS